MILHVSVYSVHQWTLTYKKELKYHYNKEFETQLINLLATIQLSEFYQLTIFDFFHSKILEGFFNL